jgi:hypothetical protein
MRLTTYTDYTLRIEETIGAISDMFKVGYVKHIGMTQVRKMVTPFIANQ